MRKHLHRLLVCLASLFLVTAGCNERIRVLSPAEGATVTTTSVLIEFQTTGNLDPESVGATLNDEPLLLERSDNTFTATIPPGAPLRIDNRLVVNALENGGVVSVRFTRSFRWLPSGLGVLTVRDALDFGRVDEGDASEATLTIRNDGIGPLTVSDAETTDPAFGVLAPPGGGIPFSIDAGSSRPITLRMSASSGSAGTALTGQLTLASNDPDRATRTIQLAGRVVAAEATVDNTPVLGAAVTGDAITAGNCASVDGSVAFHAESLASDSFEVALVDTTGQRIETGPLAPPAGAGAAVFSGLDACALANGVVSIEVEVTRGGSALPVYTTTTVKNTSPLSAPVVDSLPALHSDPQVTVCGTARANTTVRVQTDATVGHQQLGIGETEFCVDVALHPNAWNTILVSAIDDLAADPKPVAIAQPVRVAHIDPATAVISSASSRPLSPQEIAELIDSGVIDPDVPDNYSYSMFEVTFTFGAGGGAPVTVEQPIQLPRVPGSGGVTVGYGDWDFDFGDLDPGPPGEPDFPSSGWVREVMPQPGHPRPPRGGCRTSCTRIIGIQLPTGEVMPGVLTIAGNLRTLKEFFQVSLALFNNTQDFQLSGIEARVALPAGLTAMAAGPGLDASTLNATGSEDSTTIPVIAPGETGHAQFIVRGDAIGEYRIDVGFDGFVSGVGLPQEVPFAGSAATTVTVEGPPRLGVTIRHPSNASGPDVSFGQIYDLLVEIENLDDRPALYTSLELFLGGNARLVDADGLEIPGNTGIRELGHIEPGETSVASFRVKALLAGEIIACQGVASANLVVTVDTGADGAPCRIEGTLPADVETLPPDAAPALLSATPRNGAANVPDTTSIEALLTPTSACLSADTFENVALEDRGRGLEVVASDLATPGTFYLEELDAVGDPVRHVPTELTLTPAGGITIATLRLGLPGSQAFLAPSTAYRATLVGGANGVCSAAPPNARMPGSVVWTFRTGPICDAVAPSVTLVAPVDGATNRPHDQRVVLAFDEAIDPATFFLDPLAALGAPFSLIAGATETGGDVTGGVAIDGGSVLTSANRRFTFTPSAPLPPASTLHVRVTEGLRDACGNALQTPPSGVQLYSFTTAPPDTTPPAAPLVSPVPARTNAASALVTGSAEAQSRVEVSGGAAVASATANGAGGFAVSVPLTAGATHVLGVQARDAAGNASPTTTTDTASQPLVIVSDVTRPTVTGVAPANGAVDVPLDSAIEVSFDEPLQAASVSASNMTLNGGAVGGSIALVGSSTVRFTPSQLLPNNVYTLRLRAGGVRDVAGNSLASEYVASFTTTLSIPQIDSVQPAVGQQGRTVSVSLFGQNLTAPTSIAISGGGVTVTDLGGPNPTRRNLSLTIGAGAAIGMRTITFTSLGGSAQGGFQVVVPQGQPSISAILPGSGTAGQTVTARIEGQNIGIVTNLSVSGNAGVTITDLGTGSATHRDVQFTIAAGASPGARQVFLFTPGGFASSTFAVVVPPTTPTVTFVGPAGGSWSTPSNWSTGVLPTASDHVMIQTAGVVTLSTTASVRTLTLLSELSVTGNLTINGLGVTPALTVPAGAKLQIGQSGSTTLLGGADVSGTLRLASDNATNYALLTLAGNQAITGTGQIVFDSGTTSSINTNRIQVVSGTASVASGITVRGGSGQIYNGGSGALAFGGTVLPDVANRTISLLAPSNGGGATMRIEAGAGKFGIGAGGSISNTRIEGTGKITGQSGGGVLSNVTLAATFEVELSGATTVQNGLAFDGGTLRLASDNATNYALLTLSGNQAITGTGQIVFDSGTTSSINTNRIQVVSGTASVASGITVRGGSGQIFNGGSGALAFGGTVIPDVAGRTISLFAPSNGGGATMRIEAGPGKFGIGAGGSINNTRIEGTGKITGHGGGGVLSNVTLAATFEVELSGATTVQNGLAFDGGTLRLASDNATNYALLTLAGNQAITGTGQIVFDSGTTSSINTNRIQVVSGTASVASGITVRGGSGQIFNGGSGALAFGGTVIPDVANRTISLFAPSNGGGATMRIEAGPGKFGIGAGGSISNTRIEGTGKITGHSGGGVLSNVTLAATFELELGGATTVQSGLAFDGGTLRLASDNATNYALLTLAGNQAITGTGQIVFDSGTTSSINTNRIQVVSGTASVASGITVRGGSGQIYDGGSGAVANQGTIVADTADRTIFVSVPFTNQGTIGAKRSGASGTATLSFASAGPLAGTVLAGIGGTVTRSGALSLAATARLVAEIGATERGLVSVSGGTLALGGTFAPTLVGGFVPGIGTTHRFLTGTTSGAFATVEDTAIGDGVRFNVVPVTSPTGLGAQAAAE